MFFPSLLRLAVAAWYALVATASLADSVGTANAPDVPLSVSAVATGGYWEEGDRHGTVRVVVVQEGSEEISSRVFLEWLEEIPGGGMRLHRRAALDALGEEGGWSVDVPRLRPSEVGLLLELPARHAYSQEERELRVLVRGPGELFVEKGN